MYSWEGLLAELIGGIITSASPCALAAIPVAVGYVGSRTDSPQRAWWLSAAFVLGINLTLLGFGLLTGRMGVLFGNVSGGWSILVGLLLAATGASLWFRPASTCSIGLPGAMQQYFAKFGTWGTIVLGELIGRLLSPLCHTRFRCCTDAGQHRLMARLTVMVGHVAFDGLWHRPQHTFIYRRHYACNCQYADSSHYPL